MRHFKSLLFGILAVLSQSEMTFAQKPAIDAYPAKPVAVVIPYAAGGSTDNEARLYTQKLQESTGQPFVFDFRPGAGTTIGTAYVAKAAPDGYTLLLNLNTITTTPSLYPGLPYDVARSFAPISLLSNRSAIFISSVAGLPGIRNLQELVAYARANPGKVNVGTSGAGGTTHLLGVALATAAGIKLTYVHYKGLAQVSVDLVAGRTHISSGTVFGALAQIKAGKLRATAVLGTERSKILPEVKTAAEQGVNVEYTSWMGAFAPAATPAAIVNKLNAEFVKAVRAPDVVKQLDAQGSETVGSTPEFFRQKLTTELAYWKKLIEEERIKLE